jgi:hypothetical protein
MRRFGVKVCKTLQSVVARITTGAVPPLGMAAAMRVPSGLKSTSNTLPLPPSLSSAGTAGVRVREQVVVRVSVVAVRVDVVAVKVDVVAVKVDSVVVVQATATTSEIWVIPLWLPKRSKSLLGLKVTS